MKFVLNLYNGLEHIVSRELNYLISINNSEFTDKPLFDSYFIEIKKNIIKGKILLNFSLKNNDNSYESANNYSIDQVHEKKLLYNTIYDKILSQLQTINSFDIVVNELPLDEIFGKKFDDFRFKEEIDYSFLKIPIVLNNLSRKMDINNLKIDLRDVTSDRILKETNNIVLKKLNANQSSYINQLNTEYIGLGKNVKKVLFKVSSFDKSLLFSINITNKYFGNLFSNKKISRHPTPIGLQIANSMIFENFTNIQDFLKIHKESSTKSIKKIVFIDPFCGYGTIPSLVYINLLHNYEDLISSLLKSDIKIQIIGLDNDEFALNNTQTNFKIVQKEIKNVITPKIKSIFERIEIHYKQDNINNLIKYIRDLDRNNSIISIITQPPYGFTIALNESEIIEIYKSLFKIIGDISSKYSVFLSILTAQINLINTIETDMKEKKINLYLHKKCEYYRKNIPYSMYFFQSME